MPEQKIARKVSMLPITGILTAMREVSTPTQKSTLGFLNKSHIKLGTGLRSDYNEAKMTNLIGMIEKEEIRALADGLRKSPTDIDCYVALLKGENPTISPASGKKRFQSIEDVMELAHPKPKSAYLPRLLKELSGMARPKLWSQVNKERAQAAIFTIINFETSTNGKESKKEEKVAKTLSGLLNFFIEIEERDSFHTYIILQINQSLRQRREIA
jgi:hypothetical protein